MENSQAIVNGSSINKTNEEEPTNQIPTIVTDYSKRRKRKSSRRDDCWNIPVQITPAATGSTENSPCENMVSAPASTSSSMNGNMLNAWNWNGIADQLTDKGRQNGLEFGQLEDKFPGVQEDFTSSMVVKHAAAETGGASLNLAVHKPYSKIYENERAVAFAMRSNGGAKRKPAAVFDDWDENTIGEDIQKAFYSTYTLMDPVQKANTQVFFYVQPKLPAECTIPFEVNQFAYIICTPKSNLAHKVRVVESDFVDPADGQYFQRFKCSFFPKEPGVYPVIVSMRTPSHVSFPQHVDGSPFFITVVKNYVEDARKLVGVKMVLRDEDLYGEPVANGYSPPPYLWSSKETGIWSEIAPPVQSYIYIGTQYYHQSQQNSWRQNRGRVNFENANESNSKVKPWGMTYCSKTDEIFVCARETRKIQKYSSTTGEYLGSFGNQGVSAGKLNRPTSITYDGSNHRLIISDKDNHCICFYTIDGLYLSSFGSKGHSNGQFNYPWGVDVSRDGQFIVVADSRNHRIQIFNKDGVFVNKYSVFEKTPFEYKDQFNYPRGVAFDNSGKFIYISDFNLNVVLRVDIECRQHSQLISKGVIQRPQGLAVDVAGNIVICDTNSNLLRVVDSSGVSLATIGGFGNPDSAQYQTNGDCGIKFNGVGLASHACTNSGYGYDALEAPLDVCFVQSGKLAVLDGAGIIRIF